MRDWIKALPLGLALPVVVGAASVKPDDAISNIAAWVQWFGGHDIPSWLAAPSADNKVIAGAALFSIAYAVLVWGLPAMRRNRQFKERREAVNDALIINPAHVTRSPSFISDRALFDPKAGTLSPTEKINKGSLRLHQVYESAFETEDYEAYLLAGHLAEWLIENARFCFTSGEGYQKALNFATERTISLGKRFRGERTKKISLVPLRIVGTSSSYMGYGEQELGQAIQLMILFSAWGRWFAAKHLAESHSPIDQSAHLAVAAGMVIDAASSGTLLVRGHPQPEYISRDMWRYAALSFEGDHKFRIIPRDGVDPDRIQHLLRFDRFTVDCEQFEDIWPRQDSAIDAKRSTLLKAASDAGASPQEVKRLSL